MGSQLALDLRESPLKRFCDYCGAALVPTGCTTGGGVNAAGETVCFVCCGFADAIDMANAEPGQRGIPVPLYFTPGPWEKSLVGKVTNWPGSLVMVATAVTRWVRGGFGSKRRTVYFRGPKGSWWSGIEYEGPCAGNVLRSVRRLKSS